MKTRKGAKGSEDREAAHLTGSFRDVSKLGLVVSAYREGGRISWVGLDGKKEVAPDSVRSAGGRYGSPRTSERGGLRRRVWCSSFADSATYRALRRELITRCARARGPRGWLAALRLEKALGKSWGRAVEKPQPDPWVRREPGKRRGGSAGETGRWGAGALASALLGRARRRAYWKRAGSGSRSMRSGSTRLRYCCQH